MKCKHCNGTGMVKYEGVDELVRCEVCNGELEIEEDEQMKAYKIRHKPTGLFYTRHILSETGSLYTQDSGDLYLNDKEWVAITEKQHNKFNLGTYSHYHACYLLDISKSDLEIVEYELVEVIK